MSNGVKMIVNRLDDLNEQISELASKEVLVGFPEDTTDRKEPGDITNAALGYIHDNGAPEANIPARPFMIPGVLSVREGIARRMFKLGVAVLQGKTTADQGLHSVGLLVQAAMRRKINEGIEPPLSDRTLRARAAKGRVGAMWELAWRAAGAPPSTELAKPLIDTAQMRNALNYVVRLRKKRKK